MNSESLTAKGTQPDTVDTAFQQTILVIGVIIFAFACRSFAHPVIRKLSLVAVLIASYLTAFFIFNSHGAGIGALLAWFFLPWIELLTRIRKLRLPIEKKMEHKMPPSSAQFPDLNQFTREIEDQGYEYVDDAGWEWESLEQFYRIFYKEEDKTQVSICMSRQEQIAFAYVSITSRDRESRSWRSWNYPFAYAMKLPPDLIVNRLNDASSFEDMLGRHEAFLLANNVGEEHLVGYDPEPEAAHEQIEAEVQRQLDFNFARGIIAKVDTATFRYSWRGLFYLWGQFLKDIVKLS
ncbi:MAG: hypothetical protein ACI8UO_006386 [Verrucomicrobiales bacterium]